jgi:hypothetical protein
VIRTYYISFTTGHIQAKERAPAETLGAQSFIGDFLVRAVGIELKATLKARELLILLNVKNDKNSEFAQVRCTAGTRWRDALTK